MCTNEDISALELNIETKRQLTVLSKPKSGDIKIQVEAMSNWPKSKRMMNGTKIKC